MTTEISSVVGVAGTIAGTPFVQVRESEFPRLTEHGGGAGLGDGLGLGLGLFGDGLGLGEGLGDGEGDGEGDGGGQTIGIWYLSSVNKVISQTG